MDRITTTIKRAYLAEIAAGKKKTEYRDIKPYWRKKLTAVSLPFELRLRNGMHRPVPEVIVLIDRIRANAGTRQYELRIAKILRLLHWDKRRHEPK